jgi:hypothetical protein
MKQSDGINDQSGHSLSLMMYSYLKLAQKKIDNEFVQFLMLQVFMHRMPLELESCIKLVGALSYIRDKEL